MNREKKALHNHSLTPGYARCAFHRPHFIRCIKPNTTKEPWLFDSDFVLTQLRYIGLLETIRIRREGYAFRPTHHDFVRDYRILAFNPLADVPPTAASCDRILKTANICDYKLGWVFEWEICIVFFILPSPPHPLLPPIFLPHSRTKVFLKYFHYEELQRHLDGYHQATTVLTKIGRGFCVRNQARLLRRVSLMQQEQLEAFFELAAVCSTSTQRHVCQLVEADTQTRSQLLLQQHRQTEAKEAAVRQAAACELQQRLERLEANRKAAEAEAQQLARRHEEERQRQLAQEALLLQQAAERTRKEEEQAEADGDEDNNADDENEGTHRSLAVDTGPQAQLERKRREAAEQARRDSHRWQEREQAEQQRYASAVQTLRQQQQQRAQTEAAARTEREATEQKMAGKKQWQALATAQQAARNKAEEELATERNQREALQLQVLHQSDVTIRLSSQIEELRKQLRNAAQAQETAEDELAETQGLLVREQLRRQNAEELARHLQLEGTGPVGDGGEVAGLAGSQRRESQSRRAQALRMLAAAHNNGNTALPKTVGDRASETASKAEITDELLAQVNLAAYLRRRLGTLCAKPEEVVLGPAAISGYLMKQGSVNPSYQRRWFVLHLQKQVLRYFVDDTLKEHRGDIPLSDILFVGPDTSAGDGKKGSAAFSLVLGTAKRNYHVGCGGGRCGKKRGELRKQKSFCLTTFLSLDNV